MHAPPLHLTGSPFVCGLTECIAVATEKRTALRAGILSLKARLRAVSRIEGEGEGEGEKILEHDHGRRYLKGTRTVSAEQSYKQTRCGRLSDSATPSCATRSWFKRLRPTSRHDRRMSLDGWGFRGALSAADGGR
ncbi:MAG: hypothetical protein ACP5P4_10060 [Steroidobacteraceae bacterium]